MKRELAIGGAVGLVCVLLWAPLWTGEQTIFILDAASYFYPMKSALARMVAAGEWPWWNPWLRNGLPFYANPQVGLFYPPTALFYVLRTSLAFNWVVILHFLVLATGFYAWLRRIGRSHVAAALGGLAIAWGGFAVSMTIYLNNLQAIAWIGWTWWAWTAWLEERTPRWLALTALGFALQFLAGEPQIPVLTAALALLLAWSGPRHEETTTRHFGRPVLALAAAAVAALLVTAVQLLPTAELFLESGRSGGLNSMEALSWSLNPGQLYNLVLPRYWDGPEGMFDLRRLPMAFQPWVFTSYVGIAAVILAVAGTGRPNRRWSLLWWGLATAGILLALGANNPLVTRLVDLPLVRTFRYPEKLLLLPAIAVPVLAATALDRIAREKPIASRAAIVAIGIAALALTGWLLVRLGAMDGVLTWWSPGTRSGTDMEWILEGFARGFRHAALFAGILGVLLLLAPRVRSAFRGPLIVVVVVADLVAVNPGAVGLGPARLLEQWPEVLEGLPVEELRTSARIRSSPLGTASRGWFIVRGVAVASQQYFLFSTMAPNLSMVHGILAQDGIEAFRPRSDDVQSEILQRLPPEAQVRYLRLQSTKWLVHWPLEVAGLEPISERSVFRLRQYRIVDPLPRAYMVDRVGILPDSVEALNQFIVVGEDPHRIAYMSEGPGLDGAGERIDGGVRWLSGSNHSVRLRVSAPDRVMLVLTDTWYPGWRATVDGDRVPIERVNWHFRGIRLQPGEHLVRFDYRPTGVVAGGIVSLLAVIALCFVIVKGGRDGS